MNRTKTVQYLLKAYGEAMRSDWSFVDGRTVRRDLSFISSILNDDADILSTEEYLNRLGIEIDEKYGLFGWM